MSNMMPQCVRAAAWLVVPFLSACTAESSPSGPAGSTAAGPKAARRLSQTEVGLPIIPGAAGFGMDTPAGSGRHLQDVALRPGWDDALVARWSFENATPDGGTLVGDAAIVPRGKGHALSLQGKGSLKLARPEGYAKAGGSLTIMAWVRLTAPVGIVAQSLDNAGGYWRLGHFREGREKWMFRVRQGDAAHHAVWNRNVTEAKWRHLAGVYDGSTGRLRLYINGDLMHAGWDKAVKDVAATRSRHLTIGNGVHGLIDDVMLFDAALTAKQIAALYANRYSSYFGARRTTVYKVTNLNTNGPGSLQAALDAAGARVIVFEVSGNIDYTPLGGLAIETPYVTIAGQTAPPPGITLKGCQVRINTHDVLMQHIRVRVGDLLDPSQPLKNKAGWTQFSERDCMKVRGDRIVIDHCSFSWATDENVQSSANDVTYRHNIFSEGLHSPKHHKGGHSRGLLIMRPGSHRVAVLGNLFAHNMTRNPTVAAGEAVVVNNLIDQVNVALKTNCVARPGQGPVLYSAMRNVIKRANSPFVARAKHPDTRFYFAPDNVYKDKPFESVDAIWAKHVSMPFAPGVAEPCRATRPPITVPGYVMKPADEVEAWVLANAGARPADRGPVDARVVKQVRTGTGGILKSQADVGGWPDLAENHRALTIPENPDADDDGDGYTNLEEWLHRFAAEVEGR